jgi:hypothetical protein
MLTNIHARLIALCAVLLCSSSMSGAETKGQKIGVLLANHGSRSATWRQALLDLEQRVRPALLTNQAIQGVKTAFMEYTEPSIATRMKEFDAEGFTDVIIVPVFLTVSPHTFDDIPTIIGKKVDPHSLQMLKIEKIERYTARAKTHIVPNLDFTDMLKENVLRRAKSLSTNPSEEALVMIAYGDATYEKEWSALLNKVGEHVKQQAGIAAHSHGWCGHVAHYDPKKTTAAIESVLGAKKKAIVVPVLVAHDEMFQIKIIGNGIAGVADNKSRVVYRPDSILPEPLVDRWVLDVATEYVQKIGNNQRLAANP